MGKFSNINSLKLNNDQLYYFILIGIAISLPISRFTLTITFVLLIFNWVISLKFISRIQAILNNKPLLIFCIVYLVHIIWLFNTENFHDAFKDIRTKLPLLLFPVIMATSPKIDKNQLKILLWFFSASVLVYSFISTVILISSDIEFLEIREISPFISHIRFGLMINLVIVSLFYLIYFSGHKTFNHEKTIYSVVLIWLSVFLFILQSFTGILIFCIIFPLLLVRLYIVKGRYHNVGFVIIVFVGLTILLSANVVRAYKQIFKVPPVNVDSLEKYTVNGNKYSHNLANKKIENGQYVWLYVCEKELKKEWEKRSEIPYDSINLRGNKIKYTLIRYLTSVHQRKDSVGISKLTPLDISTIERGAANYIFRKKFGIYPRVYQIMWEIDVYKKTKYSLGHSLTQRFFFFETGINIIKENFWLGVGTGDVQREFNKQYDKDGYNIPEKLRRRTHNQLVTFFISFGLFGFLIVLYSMFFPVFYKKRYKEYFILFFMLIILMSMLNEDTFETHIGASFFAFFYSLFIFGFEPNR